MKMVLRSSLCVCVFACTPVRVAVLKARECKHLENLFRLLSAGRVKWLLSGLLGHFQMI